MSRTCGQVLRFVECLSEVAIVQGAMHNHVIIPDNEMIFVNHGLELLQHYYLEIL